MPSEIKKAFSKKKERKKKKEEDKILFNIELNGKEKMVRGNTFAFTFTLNHLVINKLHYSH